MFWNTKGVNLRKRGLYKYFIALDKAYFVELFIGEKIFEWKNRNDLKSVLKIY